MPIDQSGQLLGFLDMRLRVMDGERSLSVKGVPNGSERVCVFASLSWLLGGDVFIGVDVENTNSEEWSVCMRM